MEFGASTQSILMSPKSYEVSGGSVVKPNLKTSFPSVRWRRKFPAQSPLFIKTDLASPTQNQVNNAFITQSPQSNKQQQDSHCSSGATSIMASLQSVKEQGLTPRKPSTPAPVATPQSARSQRDSSLAPKRPQESPIMRPSNKRVAPDLSWVTIGLNIARTVH
jgi:hypothetical protein